MAYHKPGRCFSRHAHLQLERIRKMKAAVAAVGENNEYAINALVLGEGREIHVEAQQPPFKWKLAAAPETATQLYLQPELVRRSS